MCQTLRKSKSSDFPASLQYPRFKGKETRQAPTLANEIKNAELTWNSRQRTSDILEYSMLQKLSI